MVSSRRPPLASSPAHDTGRSDTPNDSSHPSLPAAAYRVSRPRTASRARGQSVEGERRAPRTGAARTVRATKRRASVEAEPDMVREGEARTGPRALPERVVEERLGIRVIAI